MTCALYAQLNTFNKILPWAVFPLKAIAISPKPQPIKRQIRNSRTGQFFKNGNWIANADDATNLVSISDAVRACSRYGLKETELVLTFGRKEFDIAVPICN